MREPTRTDVAEAYRVAIERGIVDPARAVAWADREIAGTDHPDPALIELSSAWRGGAAAVLAALNAMPGDADPETVARVAMALVEDVLAADPASADAVSAMLRDLAWAFPTGDSDLRGMKDLECWIDLARAGYGSSLEKARADVIAFVKQHCAPRIE